MPLVSPGEPDAFLVDGHLRVRQKAMAAALASHSALTIVLGGDGFPRGTPLSVLSQGIAMPQHEPVRHRNNPKSMHMTFAAGIQCGPGRRLAGGGHLALIRERLQCGK